MYIFQITIICTAVSHVHDVVHCSRKEKIYPYLYIIIHSGGIRYRWSIFNYKKYRTTGACGQSFTIYILYVSLRED